MEFAEVFILQTVELDSVKSAYGARGSENVETDNLEAPRPTGG
jgi:hypothetical protein